MVLHQILEKQGVAHDHYIGGDGGHEWDRWRVHLMYMQPKLVAREFQPDVVTLTGGSRSIVLPHALVAIRRGINLPIRG